VCAGISLEYYFSYVDPTGYGCGTKLPHNVTSLLGVMDGAQSDLRTGLPWQMVEIHEPTRLAIVVEGTRERLLHVVQGNPGIERLVRNRWIWIACLDAESGAVWELRSTGFVPHAAEQPLPDRHRRFRRVVSGQTRLPAARGDRRGRRRLPETVGLMPGLPLTVLVLVGVGSPAVLLALLGLASLINRPLPGAVDRRLRGGLDPDRVRRVPSGVRRVRSDGHRDATAVVRRLVDVA
jgi:hypothetical protein